MLLDTHALVWLLTGSDRLGANTRRALNDVASAAETLVSAITPWEIAMLVSKGRLAFDRDVADWLRDALALPGLRVVPLSTEIAVSCTRLPGVLPADPADRIIVATARALDTELVTADRPLLDYARAGHLKARDATR
jgi:PIN domain nuclease of toxin-antitoxin system